MAFHLDRVRRNVQEASTEDLLDRITVYRAQMEAEALPMMEEELRKRGVTSQCIGDHARQRQSTLIFVAGMPVRCHCCYRPAVMEQWGWHRLWGKLPIFPRWYAHCAEHGPAAFAPRSSMPSSHEPTS